MQVFGVMSGYTNFKSAQNQSTNFKGKIPVHSSVIRACEDRSKIIPEKLTSDAFKADLELIINKIKKYLKFIPQGAANSLPFEFETLTSGFISMFVDKKKSGVNKVTMKSHAEKGGKVHTTLNAFFDDKGLLMNADMFEDVSYAGSIQFERNNRNIRRLIKDGVEYKPVKDSTHWESIASKNGGTNHVISTVSSRIIGYDNVFEMFLDKFMQKDERIL